MKIMLAVPAVAFALVSIAALACEPQSCTHVKPEPSVTSTPTATVPVKEATA